MKNTRNIVIIIAILAVHLVFVNTEILIKLIKIITAADKTTLGQNFSAAVFALSYSLITVLIITVYPRVWMFFLSALFDGFAVYLNYAVPTWFATAAAAYLGLYTTLIIIATGFIERQTTIEQEQALFKTRLINYLTEEKRSLQQAIRRIKDPQQKQSKQNRLQQIENQLELIRNSQTL